MTKIERPPFTLKDTLFSADRVRHIATELSAVSPRFEKQRFLRATLATLESLTLMERLRHVSEQLHATLPGNYKSAVGTLRKLAPRLNNKFVTMVLPDFVALYGAHDFETSMKALAFFTRFGSSEFAVRHFLRSDLERTLAVMEQWSKHDDEHIRRLSSEGARPRLPWSFRLEPLIDDPAPVARILDNLQSDSSLYVRKSVANHLNDITKDHPRWVLERVRTWPLDDARTSWIVRHALRTLIKKGDREALAVIGAGEVAQVELHRLRVSPSKIRLGDTVTLSFALTSTGPKAQKLVVDYAVHYVRPGRIARKVFKLKTLSMEPAERAEFARKQTIVDFTTRSHHAGKHEVEVLVNGQVLGRTSFTLRD